MSIADKLNELVDCKNDIKSAIEERGIELEGGLSTYADKIRAIKGEWVPDDGLTFAYSTCKYFPTFDTRNLTDMDGMFKSCSEMNVAPELETGHITSMNGTFLYCNELTTIPQYDTSSCMSLNGFLLNCQKLTSVPLLECGECSDISSIFSGTYNITDIGGFKDLGKAMWTWVPPNTSYGEPGYYRKVVTGYAFNQCRKITKQSCLNIFNNIYDVTENPGGYTPQLNFEKEVVDRLAEEDIAIAVQKGWIVGTNTTSTTT